MAECKDCWRARKGANPDKVWVDQAEFNIVLSRLLSFCGSKAEICRKLGKHLGTFSRKRGHVTVGLLREMQTLLAQLEKEHGINGRMNAGHSAEICDPEPLGQVVRDFINKWRREWSIDSINGNAGWLNGQFLSAYDYLHEKSEIDPRKIRGIASNEYREIAWPIVDALLQAMGQSQLVYNGTIQVKPNPRWSTEAYLNYMRERGCI
jgi:hypothetical protein